MSIEDCVRRLVAEWTDRGTRFARNVNLEKIIRQIEECGFYTVQLREERKMRSRKYQS
ncbi:MAG: hypothetical protein FWH55_13845 [Oscillospiraceae bacterium]|nr:hypothetical protein [Oscillospiraceae bacterium]